MEGFVLFVLKIALLMVLWLLILLALNAMRVDANRAAGRKRSHAAPGGPVVSISREQPRQVTVVEGPLQGSHMDITTLDSLVLGRTNDCDFVLGDDYSSSHHARFFRRGSSWFVEDLESRNGTFLSGMRIDQPEHLPTGADVRMGRTTVRLVP